MDTLKDYPKHIYDPFRRKIAERYVKHELRKLFASLREKEVWDVIDRNVDEWYNNHVALAPVRDFWNGVHGISSGFKLKDIVSWLTSVNIKWQEKEIEVDKLWFRTTFPQFTKRKPSVVEVKKMFEGREDKNRLEELRGHLTKESQKTSPRDDNPIFVVKSRDKYKVVDGNRRLLQAVIDDKNEIVAYVGEPKDVPEIYEQWVPTQELLYLVSLNRRNQGGGVSEVIAKTIAEVVKHSTSGRLELVYRCLRSYKENDIQLWKRIKDYLLQSYNVSLPEPD